MRAFQFAPAMRSQLAAAFVRLPDDDEDETSAIQAADRSRIPAAQRAPCTQRALVEAPPACSPTCCWPGRCWRPSDNVVVGIYRPGFSANPGVSSNQPGRPARPSHPGLVAGDADVLASWRRSLLGGQEAVVGLVGDIKAAPPEPWNLVAERDGKHNSRSTSPPPTTTEEPVEEVATARRSEHVDCNPSHWVLL